MDFEDGRFGEKFGEKLFTASATRAAGISSSNLGAFDHAGENRDIYIYIYVYTACSSCGELLGFLVCFQQHLKQVLFPVWQQKEIADTLRKDC